MPKIPLIDELTTSKIPVGSNIIIEYEPASKWYAASITIAAGWLNQNGKVSYNTLAQPPAKIRDALNLLGIDCTKMESGPQDYEPLRIWDYYTSTLGVKSDEKLRMESLKISDISIHFITQQFKREVETGKLVLVDDWSSYARFNEEKTWIEFLLTRDFALTSRQAFHNIGGLMKGMHSGSVYNRLEASADGIVDIKVEEEGNTIRDMIRIRNLRNVHYDREWHELKLGENFEVRLEK